MSNQPKINLLNLGLQQMQQFVADCGEKPYRAVQLLQWIHQRNITNFSEMTDLNKNFRQKLQDITEIVSPTLIHEQLSSDGTYKWLFRLPDGNAIETVFIPEPNRGTLCVSSQVGCGLNCSFCSTAKEGFNRNLSVAEIIGQVWNAKRLLLASGSQHTITNVVMMGMGEPLLNYDPVVTALHLMMSDYAYGLSKYRVTLSTSGVVPALLKFKQECDAAVAVSLHAANDELRNVLVPLNKKYPLAVLMDVCRHYFPKNSKRRVTFEYVMLAGVNDSLQQAKELAKLLNDLPCKMNLIPFNPFPGTCYQSSNTATIREFQDYLTTKGIKTWVRKTRGDDIDAACGQLAGKFLDRTGRHQRWLRTGRLVTAESRIELC